MTQIVRYYRMPDGEVTPRHVGIAVVYGQWPTRVLKHRGYRPERQVALRVTTPEEDVYLAECKRLQAYFYPTVRGLVVDEHASLGAEAFSRLMRSLEGAGVEVSSAVSEVLSEAEAS